MLSKVPALTTAAKDEEAGEACRYGTLDMLAVEKCALAHDLLSIADTDTRLDGLYVEYEPRMMEEVPHDKDDAAPAQLRHLASEIPHVGVWLRTEDVADHYTTARLLAEKCDVSFINTDLPPDWLKGTAERWPGMTEVHHMSKEEGNERLENCP